MNRKSSLTRIILANVAARGCGERMCGGESQLGNFVRPWRRRHFSNFPPHRKAVIHARLSLTCFFFGELVQIISYLKTKKDEIH